MRSATACTMMNVGSILIVIPMAVMLAFAESMKNNLGDFANGAHALHALVCNIVGIGLIVLGVRGATTSNDKKAT